MFGGQVGVGGHLTIGRGAIAVGQSGVTNSLDPGAMVAGYPAIDEQRMAQGVGGVPAAAGIEAPDRGARSSGSLSSPVQVRGRTVDDSAQPRFHR